MASRGTAQGRTLTWSRNRGRNGWDPATAVADDMSVESFNLILSRDGLGQKRYGYEDVESSWTGDAIINGVRMYRFIPGQDDTAAQVLIATADPTTKFAKIAAGTAVSALTLKDNWSSNTVHLTNFATLNGKCYVAYQSAVDRLHVYAPTESATTLRRAGLYQGADAPTVANQGSGTYAAVARYYRVQYRVKSGSTVLRQSNLGTASTVFTPNGTSASARVTQGTVPNEGETHWAIFGSADGTLYYELTELPIATTFYDDTEAPATDYDDNTAAPSEGAYTPFPSVKFIVSTGERLVGYGSYGGTDLGGMTDKAGRVWFSPVLDTTDTDDDERVSNTATIKGWIDVGRNAGGEDRALAFFDNQVFVFQSNAIYALIHTGDATAPFRRVQFSAELGAVNQASTFVGEDEAGRPTLYWLDPQRGPMRYGVRGVEWMGYDVQDIWATVQSVEPAATPVAQCHGVYDPDLRAVIWWVNEGGYPTRAIVFFVREGRPTEVEGVRGGWTIWDPGQTDGGSGAAVGSSAMLPKTIGATMSPDLRMYTGSLKTTGWSGTEIMRWDSSLTTDDTANFQAYVTSKAIVVPPAHQHMAITRSYLQAKAANAVTITQTLVRNFGDETNRTSTVLLTAAGSETRVLKRFEDSAVLDAWALQITLGDGSASSAAWTLDSWTAPILTEGER